MLRYWRISGTVINRNARKKRKPTKKNGGEHILGAMKILPIHVRFK